MIDEPGWFYSDFHEKVELALTEYHDPGGRVVYFQVYPEDPAIAVDDELIQ